MALIAGIVAFWVLLFVLDATTHLISGPQIIAR